MRTKKVFRNQKIYDRSTQQWPYRPQLPSARPDEVWDRINTLLGEEPQQPAPVDEPKQRKRGEARRRRRRQRRVRLLDALGIVVWSYIVIKLFVGDFDRLLLASVAPEALWLVDLRVFFVLALAALFLMLFKLRTLGLALAYTIGYPLVLVFWKLPRALIRRRSPLFVMGLAGVITSLAVRARLFICALAIACISGLLIVLSHETLLIYTGMVAMLVTLLWWMTVTAVDLLHVPSFISAHERLLEVVLNWKVIENLLAPRPTDPVSLKKWTTEDAKAYRDSAGNTLLARRILAFWAYSLDEYRKGPSAIILNVLLILGLVAQVILTFSFLNYGVFLIDPGQFQFDYAPHWWTFGYYSATGMYFGEISALAPISGVAVIVKLLTGFVGALGVLTIISSILIGFHSMRTDRASVGAVQMLQTKADELDARTEHQFQMTSTELEERLITTSWGLLGVVYWLASNTPTMASERAS